MNRACAALLPPLSLEFAAADLGDGRLALRLWRIVDALAANPAVGFPRAMGSDAELEAFYRFVNNPRVTPQAILAAHTEETCCRSEAEGTVLVIHDTTEVEYPGVKREGLGRLSTTRQGYLAHVALAVSADQSRRPLGLLGIDTVRRRAAPPDAETKKQSKKHALPGSESERWRWLVDETEDQARGRFKLIHVMDREADSFALLSHLVEKKAGFVIRSSHDRQLIPAADEPPRRLHETMALTMPVFWREVFVSRRAASKLPKARRSHPPREARVAKLLVSAASVLVKTTTYAGKSAPSSLALNCVSIVETDHPPGVEPIDWRLWTLLPIDTPAQIAAILDIYRSRWLIEEFFKALKTGCQLEQRQQESNASLLNVLALLAPVAWRLLMLRHLARHAPQAPASSALTQTQIDVLRSVSPRPLSRHPTVREALLAVAALGGHIKNNGEPGWHVLGRGFRDLLLLELGWSARLERCDR